MISSNYLRLFVVILSLYNTLALDFNLQSNISVSPIAHGWQFRKVLVQSWNAGLWKGANYISIGVDKIGNTATIDILAGSCYVNIGVPPFAFVASFDAVASWTLGIDAGSSFATTANLTASAGYVGSSYLRLEENDANGNVVAVQFLRGALVSSSAGLAYVLTAHSDANDDPKYVTYTATSGTMTVALSFIASSVAGALNEGIIVGPKSFESVIEIKNYPYLSPTNTLTLVMGVGTGEGTLSASGQTLITKNGNSQVYFSVSKQVIASGAIKDAIISFVANSTTYISGDNVDFYNQLTAAYSGTASYNVVRVTFPAGEKDIVYDPSLGAGEPMEGVTGFAYKTEATILFSLFVSIALLL